MNVFFRLADQLVFSCATKLIVAKPISSSRADTSYTAIGRENRSTTIAAMLRRSVRLSNRMESSVEVTLLTLSSRMGKARLRFQLHRGKHTICNMHVVYGEAFPCTYPWHLSPRFAWVAVL